MSAKITSLHTQKLKAADCPLCGKKTMPPHTPFCSRGCSQLDLGNWLNDAYVIPAHKADEDADIGNLIALADKDTPLR